MAILELRSRRLDRGSNGPHISKKRRLLPEVGSLHAGQEKIHAVGVTGTVVAGKAVHGNAEEDAADIRRDLIDPVQAVETF